MLPLVLILVGHLCAAPAKTGIEKSASLLFPDLRFDSVLSTQLEQVARMWTQREKSEPLPDTSFLQHRLVQGGFFYPVVEIYFFLSSSREKLWQKLKEAPIPEVANRFGIGWAQNKKGEWLAILCFYRARVSVQPLSAFQKKGAVVQVQGRLFSPYTGATFYLGKPNGEVLTLKNSASSPSHFQVKLPPLEEEGEYRFEIVVHHPEKGPEIGWLMPIYINARPEETKREPVKIENIQEAEKYLEEKINEERVKHNRKPLILDPLLKKVARTHSQDMLQRNFFAHINPDGLTPSDRYRKAGGTGKVAENIARNEDLQDAHEQLMASPGHRANILSQEFTHFGVGVAYDGQSYLITELFRFSPEKIDTRAAEQALIYFIQPLALKAWGRYLQEDPLLSEVARENAEQNRNSGQLSFFVGGSQIYDRFKERGGNFRSIVCGAYLAYDVDGLKETIGKDFAARYLEKYSHIGVGVAQGSYEGVPNALFATICFLRR